MKHGHYIVVATAMALSACSSGTVKETLGISRSAPDEFRVVSRPPLSVPPQFNLLPPANSDASPNQQPASVQAQSLVTGGGTADTAVLPVESSPLTNHRASGRQVSGAESQFLRNAGADKADPKVRDVLVDEKFAVQEQKEESTWWDPFSWGEENKDPVVDAKKESDRLKKNEEEGKPVTNGDTPEVKQKDSGILGHILGD